MAVASLKRHILCCRLHSVGVPDMICEWWVTWLYSVIHNGNILFLQVCRSLPQQSPLCCTNRTWYVCLYQLYLCFSFSFLRLILLNCTSPSLNAGCTKIIREKDWALGEEAEESIGCGGDRALSVPAPEPEEQRQSHRRLQKSNSWVGKRCWCWSARSWVIGQCRDGNNQRSRIIYTKRTNK